MRVLLSVLAAFAATAAVAGPPLPPAKPEVLRARASLALAFAPRKPTYAEAYRQALAERKPLIVFVGQEAKPIAGCLVVVVAAFPEVDAPAVIVGVPLEAGLRRRDLPGKPSAEAIRAAAGATLPFTALLPAGRCDGTTNCRTP